MSTVRFSFLIVLYFAILYFTVISSHKFDRGFVDIYMKKSYNKHIVGKKALKKGETVIFHDL